MKCFISQRMNGLSNNEIMINRISVEKQVKTIIQGNVEFIDSNIKESPPSGANGGVWYLGCSIIQLSKADLFVVREENLNSRGCMIEYKIAKNYGIPCLIL